MVVELPQQVETALARLADQRGVRPEDLALDIIRREVTPITPPIAQDDWEQHLFSLAVDCGVSVPDAALSSDGLYE